MMQNGIKKNLSCVDGLGQEKYYYKVRALKCTFSYRFVFVNKLKATNMYLFIVSMT